MALHVITGGANVGQAAAIHARLNDTVGRGGMAVLLVPSTGDVSRALADLGTNTPVGVRIATFNDYLDGFWSELGDGRTIVTPAQRFAMLEDTVRRWSPTLLDSAARTPGMVGYLATLVQRAAESDAITPEAPGQSAGSDLLGFIGLYAQALTRAGLVEQAEAQRVVSKAADRLDLPALVAVDGFTGLSRAQEHFVRGAARCTVVAVSLLWGPHVPATTAAAALVERLVASGTHEQLPEPDASDGSELSRLTRQFGTVGNSALRSEGSLVLSEAWGESAEAARIVREIQDALGLGMSAGQIAVVFRDVASHMRALRLALDEAGIPAEFDTRVAFAATGLGRALLGLLDADVDPSNYGLIIDVLRSPYSPIGDGMLDELDEAARRTRNTGRDFVTQWCRTHEPEAGRFLEAARGAARGITGPDGEQRWYTLISAMLGRAHRGAATDDPVVLGDAGAARAFVEAVRGLSGLGSAGTVGVRVLASTLRDTPVTLTSQSRTDHVQVMGAERVRGRRYACVIVGGLVDGEFPRRMGADAVTSGVSQVLEHSGVDIASRTTTEDERLLFYAVISRPTDRLVLSWQSHDSQARIRRRSIFLEEVLDVYRDPQSGEVGVDGPPVRVLGLDSWGERPTGPVTQRRRLRALASSAAARSEPRTCDALRRSRRLTPSRSVSVGEVLGERAVFSASEIEAYLQCPFRWCVERQVRPRELDVELDAAAAGRVAHEVLATFYQRFQEEAGQRRVTPASLATARRIHADVSSAATGRVDPRSASEAAAVRSITGRTWRLIEADVDLFRELEPAMFEWSFGIEDDPEDFGDFALAGRVDRIDADGMRAVVIDYKSGTIDAKHAHPAFESQGLVQLPLYAAVVKRRLGLTIGGGVYRSTKGGKPRGFVHDALLDATLVRTDALPESDITTLIDAAVARAATAVRRMRAGEVPAQPIGGTCPPYCVARSFCAGWRPGRG